MAEITTSASRAKMKKKMTKEKPNRTQPPLWKI